MRGTEGGMKEGEGASEGGGGNGNMTEASGSRSESVPSDLPNAFPPSLPFCSPPASSLPYTLSSLPSLLPPASFYQ